MIAPVLRRSRTFALWSLVLMLVSCAGGQSPGQPDAGEAVDSEPSAATGAPATQAAEPAAPATEEAGGAPPEGGAGGEVVLVQVGASAANWPAYIGVEEGFFSDHGVEVGIVSAGSSSGVAQQITAGGGQIGVGGIPDFVRAIQSGADLTMFANEVARPPYDVYAAPDISDWQDLEGQIVLTGGPSDITTYYFDAMAEANDLDTSSLTYLYTGSTSNRFAALVSGSVKATLLGPPFTGRAAAEGFTNLGRVVEVLPESPFTGWAVSNSWAEANRETFVSFCAGMLESMEWLNDPANRDAAISILSTVTETPPEASQEAYDYYVQDLVAFPPDARLDVAGVDALLAELEARGMLEEAGSAEDYIDQSCLDEVGG